MKKIFFFFLPFFIAPVSIYSYTAAYIGWEPFANPGIPANITADNLVFGVVGNTATRVYFYYHVLGNFIFTKGETTGNLGWGLELGGGIGYRFLSATHKKSGWDLGTELFTYFSPQFLNSQTGFTETTLYYGVGLGLNTIYKINPYIGLGLRSGLKYNIGMKSLSAKFPSLSGISYYIGALISF